MYYRTKYILGENTLDEVAHSLLFQAAMIGDEFLWETAVAMGATDYNAALIVAAYKGHENICRKNIDRLDMGDVFINCAASGGHKSIVELAVQHGHHKTFLYDLVQNAVYSGDQETLKYVLSLSKANMDRYVEKAAFLKPQGNLRDVTQ